MKLAERIAASMKQDNITSLGWGDNCLVDYVADFLRLKNEHPLNRMRSAINAMENSPELFEKFYRRGHDSRGRNRVTRCFKLKNIT